MTHPYEPAAQIAESAADRYVEGTSYWNDLHKIARRIRALPHPPERVLPVFTADWVLDIMLSANNPAFFPEAINARISASGFAQSDLASEPLAPEGFRLGDANETPIFDKKHPRFMAGYIAGLNDNDLENAANVQARIDAAVLAEREACAEKISAAAVMQRKFAATGTASSLEYEHAAIQLENLASTIRARTTDAEIATDRMPDAGIAPSLARQEEIGGKVSIAAGESPAPNPVELLRQRVTVLEYALLDVAKQARPLREWGGNVGQVMIAARKNGWEGTGK